MTPYDSQLINDRQTRTWSSQSPTPSPAADSPVPLPLASKVLASKCACKAIKLSSATCEHVWHYFTVTFKGARMLKSPWFHSSLVQALPGLFRKHLFPLNRWETICLGCTTDSDSAVNSAAAFLTPKSGHTHGTTFMSPASELNADVAGTLSRRPTSHDMHTCTFSLEDHILCLELIFVLWGHVAALKKLFLAFWAVRSRQKSSRGKTPP